MNLIFVCERLSRHWRFSTAKVRSVYGMTNSTPLSIVRDDPVSCFTRSSLGYHVERGDLSGQEVLVYEAFVFA